MIRTASLVAACSLALVLAGCSDQDKKESIEHQNKAAQNFANKSFENAITEYKAAINTYPENHEAYYGLGVTYNARGNQWKEASEAFANAVRLKDDNPTYQMWYGIALYMDALTTAKTEAAKREGKKAEEVDVNMKSVNLDNAIQHLQAALKLNNEMWRAHYYLGVIYRDQDKPQLAAQEFTAAIQMDPTQQAPFVGLAELYRKWDYTDAAIQVALQGQQTVPGSVEKAEIDYTLGMGYFEKKNYDAAIQAFTQALTDSNNQDHKALFERGLALYAVNKPKDAQKDLTEYSKVAGASEDFNKSMANHVLMDIMSKQN